MPSTHDLLNAKNLNYAQFMELGVFIKDYNKYEKVTTSS